MQTKLFQISAAIVAQPWKVRAVVTGVALALALFAGVLPQEIAMAGNATGGVR